MTQTPDYQSEQVEEDFGLNFDLAEDTDELVDDIEINLAFDADEAEEAEDETPLNLDLTDDDEADEAEPGEESPAVAEADAEAEEALAELREELLTKVGDWYVVHTYSGMENRVKQNIDSRVKTLNMEDFIFETVVPTEDAVEMRNGQKKNVTRTYLPGYILVRMDMNEDSWGAIRHTPSVTGFVGHHANEPVPLSLAEVEQMLTPSVMSRLAAQHKDRPARTPMKVDVMDYRVGDQVMVVEGPFAGIHATVTEINTHNQRLRANVEILGRETPVDLTFQQIQKVV